MLYEDLTYAIRAAIFNVHKELGPGLLKVYMKPHFAMN
jgi:hypothetical protein